MKSVRKKRSTKSAQNRWIRKVVASEGDSHAEQRRIFIYDGNHTVMDFWRTNSGDMQVGHLRQRYLWGPAVDQILAEEAVDGGTADLVQWTLTDHLNTVRDIAKYDPGSDMTTAVNHLIYDALGKVTSESNPTIDSLLLFTGRPFDSATQLQNNLNRWYDARVGRWLSENPIGFNGGDANVYRYVGNGSQTQADPEGYFKISVSVCRKWVIEGVRITWPFGENSIEVTLAGQSRDGCRFFEAPHGSVTVRNRFLWTVISTCVGPRQTFHPYSSCGCVECYSYIVSATWQARKFGVLPLKYAIQTTIWVHICADGQTWSDFASAIKTPMGWWDRNFRNESCSG